MTETKCIKNCTKARMTRKAEERTKAMIEWLDTNCPKMTKEEIINGLKLTIGKCLFDPYTVELSTEQISFTEKLTIDACKGAIDLLEKEPTKDEVILTKKEYRELVLSEFDNGYAKGFSKALEETLKNEPVLDNIRAEIEELHLIGYATVDGKRELASKAVMQIIDKYRTGRSEKE